MNNFTECGSDCTDNSDVMLWETIKVDLGINRSCQTEQLQSLKGSSVKLSPSKRKVRKHVKRDRRERTRFISKKAAIKTALGMIKAVTRKMKFGRKVSTISHNHTSVMNFKVYDNPPKPGNKVCSVHEKNHVNEDCENRQKPTLMNEASQTKPPSLEDKSSQTIDDHNLHFCDVVTAHLTRLPRTYGMPCASWCPQPVINMCSCSVSHQTPPQAKETLPDKQVPLSGANLSTQYTLKQICEELLVQLSTRREIISNKKSTEDDHNEIVEECSAETSKGPSDTTASDLRLIAKSLQTIQSDLKKSVFAHQQETPNSVLIARTDTNSGCVYPVDSKAVSFKANPQEEHMTPRLTNNTVPPSVTPDLLQLLTRDCTKNLGTSSPAQVCLSGQLFTAPEMINQQKGLANLDKEDILESNNWSTLIPLEGHSDKILQHMLDAGLVTIVNAAGITENISSNVNFNEDRGDKNFTAVADCKTDKENNNISSDKAINSTTESSNESTVTKSSNKSDDYVLALESEESDLNTNVEGNALDKNLHKSITSGINFNIVPTINYNELKGTLSDSDIGRPIELKLAGCEVNSSSSSSNDKFDVGSPKTSEKESACTTVSTSKQSDTKSRSDILMDLETKIIATTNESKCPSPETEMRGSVAFEEMDPSEMENILMVWRQQEQLHQNQQIPEKSSSSSQDSLFKMTKRTRELPPELQNIRIHQPPPLKKDHQLSKSALQILDEEANEPLMRDEDDVPEISPTVLPTPKRRRLSLKKNPPSALPLVFNTKIHAAEGLKSKGENLLLNGKGHTNAAQTQGSQEIKLSDDDTPLSLRTRARKKASATNTHDSSEKQETKSLQTGVQNGSTQKENSEKVCSKSVPEEKSSPQTVKSHSVLEQTENSKKGNSKNIEEPTDCTKKKDKGKKIEKPTDNSKKDTRKNIGESTENSKKVKSKNVEEPTNHTTKLDTTKEAKMTMTYGEIVSMAQNIRDSDKKQDFHDQIKKRLETLNKKWLAERSVEDPKVETPLVPQSISPTQSDTSDLELSQGTKFKKKTQKIRELSVYELGKGHDIAVNILLNPWRGINARRATRDYEPPKYDSKCISRALWDLRSGANPEEIVDRILSVGWKDVDAFALKTMVSMFICSLARKVPFIIEAAKNGEEDDTCSIFSDFDQSPKRKASSVRVVATRNIFKGEVIEGLCALFLKPSQEDKDKDRLKTWVFPKLGESRNFVIFGPLAYLKRKEGNSNTEALFFKGDIVIAKATRQILSGERLLVSYKRLEKCLS